MACLSVSLLCSNEEKSQAKVKAQQEYLAKQEKNKRARGKSKELGDELLEEVGASPICVCIIEKLRMCDYAGAIEDISKVVTKVS